MLTNWLEWIGFHPATVVGIGFWGLALYWGFAPLNEKLVEKLLSLPWLGFDQMGLLSGLLGILPLLALAIFTESLMEWTLGCSWAVSGSVIASMAGGIYELGRRDSQSHSEK
ncbi:MAG: hypothetical protein NW237_07145 [Cyanobacteriota bacterium]|nr:hypothetical protein [Cyanobacteriota bacterium]